MGDNYKKQEKHKKRPRGFFFCLKVAMKIMAKKLPTRMGFEPTRAEHIGLAVQRLNHSATSSTLAECHKWKECMISEKKKN